MRRVQAPDVRACRRQGPKPEGPHDKGSSQTVTGRGGQPTLREQRNAPSSLFHFREGVHLVVGAALKPADPAQGLEFDSPRLPFLFNQPHG